MPIFKRFVRFLVDIVDIISPRRRKILKNMRYEATSIIKNIPRDEFIKVKAEVFRLMINQFYQKKLEGNAGHELGLYDVAKKESDLVELNQLPDEAWREIIIEMVYTSLKIINVMEREKKKLKKSDNSSMRMALLNVPALRRLGFKVIH